MLWQGYALGATAANAIENIIDKAVITDKKEIDDTIATFYRVAAFTVFSILLGLTGLAGSLTVKFPLPFIIFAFLSLISSYCYTYLLKNIEISANGILSYLTPFFFLLADLFIFSIPFELAQIIGIILLVLGAVLFVFDLGTFTFKAQYTRIVWLIFLFDLFLSGFGYYVFKHYSTNLGLNEISYIVSIWSLVAVGMLFIVICQRKIRLLFSSGINSTYLKGVAVSKAIDTVSALFWFRALAVASVSQVDAMESFYPVFLLITIYIVQKGFKLNVEEDIGSAQLLQKIIGTILLCVGGVLAS